MSAPVPFVTTNSAATTTTTTTMPAPGPRPQPGPPGIGERVPLAEYYASLPRPQPALLPAPRPYHQPGPPGVDNWVPPRRDPPPRPLSYQEFRRLVESWYSDPVFVRRVMVPVFRYNLMSDQEQQAYAARVEAERTARIVAAMPPTWEGVLAMINSFH